MSGGQDGILAPGIQLLGARRVFDGIAAEAHADAFVAVRDDRIEGVGPLASLGTGDRSKVRDLGDVTIMPGWVDAHTHLTLFGDGRSYEEMASESNLMMAMAMVDNMARHLRAGVTTLRDNGGRDRVVFEVREAQRRGLVFGPRLLLSGRPVTPPGGHFHWCNGVASGVEQIRELVQRLAAEGADHIKIMASGGATAGTRPELPSFSDLELRAAVEAAHEGGRLTTAHARASASMTMALDAGIDCVEHAHFMEPFDGRGATYDRAEGWQIRYDGEVTRRFLDAGAFVSVTPQAGGYHALKEGTAPQATPDGGRKRRAARERMEWWYQAQVDVISRLLGDGIEPLLVISTDAGAGDVVFGKLAYGVEIGVQAGMSVGSALVSITSRAAAACGISHLVGSLEPGMKADLTIVEGDPWRDLGALHAVREVWLDGRIAFAAASGPGRDGGVGLRHGDGAQGAD